MNADACAVCGLPMDRNRASCNQCGAEFHLALRTDVAMQDCGDAWIDDEVQALVFGCNRCLDRMPAEPAASGKRYARRNGTSARAVARARKRGTGS